MLAHGDWMRDVSSLPRRLGIPQWQPLASGVLASRNRFLATYHWKVVPHGWGRAAARNAMAVVCGAS